MDIRSAKTTAIFVLQWVGVKLWWAIKKIGRGIWGLGPFLVRVVGVLALILVMIFFVLDTKRDVAYRYSVPGSPACAVQHENAAALAAANVDNDERSSNLSPAIKKGNAFTCMLQRHALGSETTSSSPGNHSLSYYLSFLEFQENGVQALVGEDKKPLERLQLAVLLDHLAQQKKAGKQNFVFAFIHGWRHDARIGDENVQNVRLMAAYLANFLQQRCETHKRYCNAAVTAVYIGWRGARLNESRIPISALNNFFAGMTLFDRKPVSERIAPAVISALEKIDGTLQKPRTVAADIGSQSPDWFERPRFITIGHSLGGNVLASGLRDEMVELILRNDDFDKPDEKKTLVKPPFGDLIVLLNPASEAENWIALQRAFRTRMKAEVTAPAFQRAYAVRQTPIYISLTAAHYWPANDILASDVTAMN